jgi:hypothetical protein
MARKRTYDEHYESRPIWWWFLCMPGAVVMWFEYMFPENVRGVFGTARRRKIRGLQFLYTCGVYFIIAIAVMHIDTTRKLLLLLISPFVQLLEVLFGRWL